METRGATLDDLNALLSSCSFIEPYRLRALSCSPGECEIELPYRESLDRPGGSVNGPALMAAADVAMWLAILTTRGTHEQWVTADFKSSFLTAARGENVICRARVMKLGARSAYATADCSTATVPLAAHHVGTYVLRE
jgi:uncharacterized protein (TIGR00369 family)